MSRDLSFFVALPVVGLLVHAVGDLPFRIYSLQLLFVVLGALLVLTRANAKNASTDAHRAR